MDVCKYGNSFEPVQSELSPLPPAEMVIKLWGDECETLKQSVFKAELLSSTSGFWLRGWWESNVTECINHSMLLSFKSETDRRKHDLHSSCCYCETRMTLQLSPVSA